MKQGIGRLVRTVGRMAMLILLFRVGINGAVPELDLQRDQPIPARVLEVIESNVYKLLVYDQDVPKVEVIALIGVKPSSDQNAYEYSVKKLLNQPVYLLADSSIPPENGIRHYYLYADFHISHNEDLIRQGFATVDPGFMTAKEYIKYSRSQEFARKNSQGIYRYSDQPSDDRIININSAGIEQLKNHFGIDEYRAGKWFARIAANPINRMAELRALDSEFFTSDSLPDYMPQIHLSTDLRTATPYELVSLTGRIGNHSGIPDQILKYRLYQTIRSEEDYNKIPIAAHYRKAIRPYLTFHESYDEFSDAESKVVNINTANQEQIMTALGVSSAQAVILTSYRQRVSYPLRNAEELFKPYFPLNKEAGAVDVLADNIRMITDINRANENEIRSLFGQVSMSGSQLSATVQSILSKRPFAGRADLEKVIGTVYTSKIANYIYFDRLPQTNYWNLNTSGKDRIAQGLGLSANETAQLRANYLDPRELPSFLLRHKEAITLYTNVNRASYDEFLKLSPYITTALAKELSQVQSREGFYTLAEVQKLFEKHNAEDTFHKLKPYLILQ